MNKLPKLEKTEEKSDNKKILLEIISKNFLILPNVARDINVANQNLSKIIKIKGEKPAKSADMYFLKSKELDKKLDVQKEKVSEKFVKVKPVKPVEAAGEPGGFSLGSFLTKNLLKSFSRIFSFKNIVRVLGRLAIPALIVSGIWTSINSAWEEWKESGSIWEAYKSGVGGLVEFLTFGLIDKETVKNFYGMVEEFVAPFFEKMKEVFSPFKEFLVPKLKTAVNFLSFDLLYKDNKPQAARIDEPPVAPQAGEIVDVNIPTPPSAKLLGEDEESKKRKEEDRKKREEENKRYEAVAATESAKARETMQTGLSARKTKAASVPPAPAPAPAAVTPAATKPTPAAATETKQTQPRQVTKVEGSMLSRAVEAVKEFIKLGLTNKYTQEAILKTAAKESGISAERSELGAKAWEATISNNQKTFTYAKGTPSEKSGLTGYQYMREVFPQLKTLNGGEYMSDEKLLKAVQSGDEFFFDMAYGILNPRQTLGNKEPGDGYKYRGRGYIQITGRNWYDKIGKAIGENLIQDPDLLTKNASIAAKATLAYMAFSFSKNDFSKGIQILNSFQDQKTALNYILLNVASGGAGLNEKLLAQKLENANFQQQIAKAEEKGGEVARQAVTDTPTTAPASAPTPVTQAVVTPVQTQQTPKPIAASAGNEVKKEASTKQSEMGNSSDKGTQYPQSPGQAKLVSPYGIRTIGGNTHLHDGLDFSGTRGLPIQLLVSGKVVLAREINGYGNTIDINVNGDVLRFGHLDRIDVKQGQEVPAKTIIGLLGNTGLSYGPHLHFEHRTKSSFQDGTKTTFDPLKTGAFSLIAIGDKPVYNDPKMVEEGKRRQEKGNFAGVSTEGSKISANSLDVAGAQRAQQNQPTNVVVNAPSTNVTNVTNSENKPVKTGSGKDLSVALASSAT